MKKVNGSTSKASTPKNKPVRKQLETIKAPSGDVTSKPMKSMEKKTSVKMETPSKRKKSKPMSMEKMMSYPLKNNLFSNIH